MPSVRMVVTSASDAVETSGSGDKNSRFERMAAFKSYWSRMIPPTPDAISAAGRWYRWWSSNG